MKYLAILLVLYPVQAVPEKSHGEWWMAGAFGYCTKTDRAELGGCGKLEVKSKPNWNLK